MAQEAEMVKRQLKLSTALECSGPLLMLLTGNIQSKDPVIGKLYTANLSNGITMKTERQIKEWLENQPYYDELKKNLHESIIPANIQKELMSGLLGKDTMRYAVMFLDPKKYDWDKIEDDFNKWFE